MASETKMFVGTCIVTLALHGNASLKGKRSVVNRVKNRLKNRFNLSVAEVGYLDRLQTAAIGISCVGNDRAYLEGQLEKAVDFISGLTEAEIADVERSIELKGGEHAFL